MGDLGRCGRWAIAEDDPLSGEEAHRSRSIIEASARSNRFANWAHDVALMRAEGPRSESNRSTSGARCSVSGHADPCRTWWEGLTDASSDRRAELEGIQGILRRGRARLLRRTSSAPMSGSGAQVRSTGSHPSRTCGASDRRLRVRRANSYHRTRMRRCQHGADVLVVRAMVSPTSA